MLSDTLDRTDDGAFAAAVEAAATSTATSTRASLKGFSTVSFGALISAAVTVTVNPGSMPLATTAQRTAFVATIQNTLCQGITRPCVANLEAWRRQLLGDAGGPRALASNARLTVSREYYTSQSGSSVASLVASVIAGNGGSVVSSTLTSLSATIPNALEFAQWIAQLHSQPCHVVYTGYRPTPLMHYIFPAGGDGIYNVVDEKAK